MEAEVIRLRGTPSEVASALKLLPSGDNYVHLTPEEDSRPLTYVAEWMDEWAIPTRWRSGFERVVETTSRWAGVELKITSGREGATDTAGRVRFVYREDRRGFAFLHHRGRLFLDLPNNIDLSVYPLAGRRTGKAAKHRFSVAIYVRTREGVEQALQLLNLAYEKAKSRG